MKINDFKYDDIKVNYVFEFKRTISGEDINTFAKLTGDFNPLHCDEEFAKSTIFKGIKIHGMLAGSLFSTLVGMVCPGKRNIYLTQSLNFRNAIDPNSEIVVKGKIKNKIHSIKVVVIETKLIANGIVAIDGEARVKVLDY